VPLLIKRRNVNNDDCLFFASSIFSAFLDWFHFFDFASEINISWEKTQTSSALALKYVARNISPFRLKNEQRLSY